MISEGKGRRTKNYHCLKLTKLESENGCQAMYPAKNDNPKLPNKYFHRAALAERSGCSRSTATIFCAGCRWSDPASGPNPGALLLRRGKSCSQDVTPGRAAYLIVQHHDRNRVLAGCPQKAARCLSRTAVAPFSANPVTIRA
jgi:hypothetical protein